MPDATEPLREADLDPDPLRQFAAWFELARNAGVAQPEAAVVATALTDSAPSARFVLVKRFDERGFVFFTNYESRKGHELHENPRAALVFYWEPLGCQVRIEGPVETVAPEESAAHIRSRPRESQLSALASPQSRVVESRAWLELRRHALAQRYVASELPLPEHWGGFRVRPLSYEFWQQREHRFHDRIRYVLDPAAGWRRE